MAAGKTADNDPILEQVAIMQKSRAYRDRHGVFFVEGVTGFILAVNDIDPFAPAVLRAALGATLHQTFVGADWLALRSWIIAQKCPVIGASPQRTSNLHRLQRLSGAPLIVLGDERRGLTKMQTDLYETTVRIPMVSGTDSLNLSVAESLLMYEVLSTQEHGRIRPTGFPS